MCVETKKKQMKNSCKYNFPWKDLPTDFLSPRPSQRPFIFEVSRTEDTQQYQGFSTRFKTVIVTINSTLFF